MIDRRGHTKVVLSTLLVVVLALTISTSAQAAGPIKLIPASHFGWKVNENGSDACLVSEKCQPGTASKEVGGFEYPEGVAGAPNGNFYVADRANHRIQEFTPSGEFILMFGKEVNQTTHGNICTEEEIKHSDVKCQAGVVGAEAAAFAFPLSVTVDPVTDDLYIVDYENNRVDEYGPSGQFLLMIGSEVNATNDAKPHPNEAEKNLCTAASGNTCKTGVKSSLESSEEGGFDFDKFQGNFLAVGNSSSGHLLYVGDAHRIQIFDAEGEFKGEDRLSPATLATAPSEDITAVAVDPETGDLFFVYNNQTIVHRLLPSGEEGEGFDVAIGARGAVRVRTIAADSAGQLAVVIQEENSQSQLTQSGLLYRATTGQLITKFTVEGEANVQGVAGVGFNGNNELYATIPQSREVISYRPVPVAELQTKSATCSPGVEREEAAIFDCTLGGEVDPYGIAQTEAWFEWGRTCALGSVTAKQDVKTVTEELLPISATIEGLRPNESFCFQITGVDENARSPETLTGEKVSFSTPRVAPKVLGTPDASFVTFASADLYGELNPENAPSGYFFEYAPAAGDALEKCTGRTAHCAGVADTAALESAQYGSVATTLEADNLQPSTPYRYRLAVVNQAGQTNSAEGEFTTAPGPKVEAESVAASAVTSTSALASGIVRPDGQSAVYAFEVGTYNGSATQYATVFSGQTGASTGDEAEAFTLTGLQPGTTYAYRISVDSGYGDAQGAPVLFATVALPSLLTLPAPTQMLPTPSEGRFPKVAPVCKSGYALNKQDKCVKDKKKKKKKATTKKAPRKLSRRR